MELVVIEKHAYLQLKLQIESLQGYREYGIIPYSCIGGKYMYKESDLAKILIQKER